MLTSELRSFPATSCKANRICGVVLRERRVPAHTGVELACGSVLCLRSDDRGGCASRHRQDPQHMSWCCGQNSTGSPTHSAYIWLICRIECARCIHVTASPPVREPRKARAGCGVVPATVTPVARAADAGDAAAGEGEERRGFGMQLLCSARLPSVIRFLGTEHMYVSFETACHDAA
jgi:hypothetical protein